MSVNTAPKLKYVRNTTSEGENTRGSKTSLRVILNASQESRDGLGSVSFMLSKMAMDRKAAKEEV